MNQLRVLLAFVVACLQFSGPLQAQQTSRDAGTWRTYEFKDGRFKAAFPGTPLVKKGKFPTDLGYVNSARHTAGDADATYDVRYNDYPTSTTSKLTPAKMLEAMRDGLVAESKGDLAWDKPYSLGRFAGRDQEIVGGDGTRYRIRLLLVENRLYQLTAMARPPARADEDRFFGSFQLVGIQP